MLPITNTDYVITLYLQLPPYRWGHCIDNRSVLHSSPDPTRSPNHIWEQMPSSTFEILPSLLSYQALRACSPTLAAATNAQRHLEVQYVTATRASGCFQMEKLAKVRGRETSIAALCGVAVSYLEYNLFVAL